MARRRDYAAEYASRKRTFSERAQALGMDVGPGAYRGHAGPGQISAADVRDLVEVVYGGDGHRSAEGARRIHERYGMGSPGRPAQGRDRLPPGLPEVLERNGIDAWALIYGGVIY